jgi:GTP cyclohydrolase II
VRGLQEAGIAVDRREPHQVGVHEDNERYMETKRVRMGHLLGD